MGKTTETLGSDAILWCVKAHVSNPLQLSHGRSLPLSSQRGPIASERF